ncbi:response regulator [Cryptosporangium arvum]|uniref:Response regulator containing a CheY-like receiver domain and an HTH DNA-binding domain n=1 Tax=Cryptosporangium arvum DSM 44712 TaxID=927661 RepID=A0A010YM50_9ACTN|nr:response regulator transcription factor [Cryptosporangium arvum]EXG81265.1 response regulator containing a CheY-like receiver domain and an HTH DNA-binding domain [Cryptosporangium arvum DSM 44712]
MIRLLLADDHPVVRDGLRGMFDSVEDIEVVGEASDGEQAVLQAVALRPDVVVMDLRMPGGGGVEAIRELRHRGVAARVLVLTTFDEDADVLDAVAAGATGYLLKDAPGDELLRAVRSAHRGEAVLSPAVASRLMTRAASPPPVAASPGLSKRELEVLRLVAAGATNREAAKTLFISETTVKTHLLHLFEKLGVRDRASAVDAAHRAGLLS